jgi:DNA-binding transcriptional MerR regulator
MEGQSKITDTALRVATHRERVKAMKLRQCMKTLDAVGITIAELKEYIDKIGFSSLEQERKAKIADYRKAKATDRKRVQNLKASLAAKREQTATKKVRTLVGNKTPLEM